MQSPARASGRMKTIQFAVFLVYLALVFHHYFSKASPVTADLSQIAALTLSSLARYVGVFLVNAVVLLPQKELLDVGLALAFVLAAYGLGRKLLRAGGYLFQFILEECAFATAVGLIVFATIGFLLGVVGGIYKFALVAIVIGFGLYGLPEIRKLFQAVWNQPWLQLIGRNGRDTWTYLLMLLTTGYILVFVSIAFVGCLLPEIEFDPLIYHLTGPKLYLEAHRILDVPEILELAWPKNIEMLYIFGLALHSQITVKFIDFFIGMLLLLSIFAVGRRFFNAQLGLIAAALFVSVPVVLFELRSVYVDIPIAFFCFLNVYAVILWMQGAGRKWLILSAIFLAMAAGAKYNTLFNVVAATALVSYQWRFRQKLSTVRVLLRALAYAGVAGSGLVPWLILTYTYTGDPLFPYLSGDPLFSFFRNWFPSDRWELYNPAVVNSGAHRWGLPLNWSNLIRTLWEMHWDGLRFCGRPGPFFVLLVPLLIVVHRLHPILARFLAYSAIYLGFWIVTTPANRYLIPVMPLMCLVCAGLLQSFLQVQTRVQQGGRAIVVSCLMLMAFYNLPFFFYLRQNGKTYFSPVLDTYARKFFVEPYSRENYLGQFLWSFPAINFVNSLPEVSRVLYVGFHDGPPLYYANFPMVYNELKVYNQFVQESSTARLLGLLQENNISHVIVEQAHGMGSWLTSPRSGFVHEHLKLLWKKNAVSVYQVSLKPLPKEEYEVWSYLPEQMLEARVTCKRGWRVHPPSTYLGVFAAFTEPRFCVVTLDRHRIRIPLDIPNEAILQFGLGVRRHTLSTGFVCKVTVRDASGVDHRVFSRYLNPGVRFDDRGWQDEIVDLSSFAGQRVELILSAKADSRVQPVDFPREIPDGLVLWSEPQILKYRLQRVDLTQRLDRFLLVPGESRSLPLSVDAEMSNPEGSSTNKNTLVIEPGGEAHYRTFMPRKVRLGFQLSRRGCRGKGTWVEILWERSGTVRTLFQKALSPSCSDAPETTFSKEWIDLSEFSGRTGTLIFRSSAVSEEPEDMHVEFHDLTLEK